MKEDIKKLKEYEKWERDFDNRMREEENYWREKRRLSPIDKVNRRSFENTLKDYDIE